MRTLLRQDQSLPTSMKQFLKVLWISIGLCICLTLPCYSIPVAPDNTSQNEITTIDKDQNKVDVEPEASEQNALPTLSVLSVKIDKSSSDEEATTEEGDTAEEGDSAEKGDTGEKSDTAEVEDTGEKSDSAEEGDTGEKSDTEEEGDTAEEDTGEEGSLEFRAVDGGVDRRRPGRRPGRRPDRPGRGRPGNRGRPERNDDYNDDYDYGGLRRRPSPKDIEDFIKETRNRRRNQVSGTLDQEMLQDVDKFIEELRGGRRRRRRRRNRRTTVRTTPTP